MRHPGRLWPACPGAPPACWAPSAWPLPLRANGPVSCQTSTPQPPRHSGVTGEAGVSWQGCRSQISEVGGGWQGAQQRRSTYLDSGRRSWAEQASERRSAPRSSCVRTAWPASGLWPRCGLLCPLSLPVKVRRGSGPRTLPRKALPCSRGGLRTPARTCRAAQLRKGRHPGPWQPPVCATRGRPVRPLLSFRTRWGPLERSLVVATQVSGGCAALCPPAPQADP